MERYYNALERFEELDSNNDNVISFEEACDALGEDYRAKRDTEMPQWFTSMDVSGDGLIQPGELDYHLL